MATTRSFTAKYKEDPMTYRVTWWKNRVNGVQLATGQYSYGSEAIYTGSEDSLAPEYNQAMLSYNLFSGWDKSTAFVTGDTDVVAKWETGYTPGVEYPEDIREWSAAQFYTVAQKNEMFKYFAENEYSDVSNNDRVRIPMGYEINYSNIETIKVIEEPMVFDGTKFHDTGIKLMEEDKDWTLFFDVQFINAAAGAVIASCYNDVVSMGFQIKNASASESSAYPFVTYASDASAGSSGTNVTDANSGYGWSREVFVLTHKKGDTFITSYTGFLNELSPRKKKLNATVDQSHPMSLILGAQKKANGAITAYAKGIVHHCEM